MRLRLRSLRFDSRCGKCVDIVVRKAEEPVRAGSDSAAKASRATPALLISASAKPGGSERAFLSLCKQLPGFGVRPAALLLERGPLEGWLLEAGCESHVLNS